jgi:hypothetical protein
MKQNQNKHPNHTRSEEKRNQRNRPETQHALMFLTKPLTKTQKDKPKNIFDAK